MKSPLKELRFNEGGGKDLWVKFEADKPVKVRVVTTDPYINKDKFGNTKFSFVVWNWTADKPQIISKGWGLAKSFQELDSDEDYGADITKLDIKITPTGEGLERRYSVIPLPKAGTLTDEQWEALHAIDLEKIIGDGLYASQYNQGERLPEARAEHDSLDDLAPANLEDIFPE